jgi:hypothetical protein
MGCRKGKSALMIFELRPIWAKSLTGISGTQGTAFQQCKDEKTRRRGQKGQVAPVRLLPFSQAAKARRL